MTRNSSVVRVIGSIVSWLLFSLSFTLLVEAVFGVMSVGGACASGNTPYVIAHQCPDASLWAAPAVFGGLIAVFASFFLAQGFGTSLVVLAWPILFGVLGGVFLSSLEIVGYLLGAMFLVMAAIPLILALRASAQRVFLGAVDAAGVRFTEGPNARQIPYSVSFADSDNPVSPTAVNWLASILIWLVSSGVGFWLALKIDGGV
ncbi:MAG: hypothetical protein JWN80_165 [Microbacteriaceae bacterium]|nr:hypothetical protein [Microbacteriaceae bacterium]